MADKKIKYKICRRKIKYPRLEYKTGELVIIAPFRFEISSLIKKHKKWILSKTEFIEETIKELKKERLVIRNKDSLENLINKFIEKARKILEVAPQRIYFRAMKTKWASCSKNQNITFNILLKYLPENLIWYVVFHELCHLIIPSHNKKFWTLISKEFEDPEKLERKLFGYWFLIWKKIKN